MNQQAQSAPTPIVPKVRVGRTAIEVSKMGLGTAPIGGLYGLIPEEQAIETVRYAVESGVTFIDTATSYGPSEQRIGLALNGYSRSGFTIATKTGRVRTPDHRIIFDFSRDGVLRSVEDSLLHLHVEQIDILHLHDAYNHYREAIDVAFPVLAELRSQGVIRAIGAGMGKWRVLADCVRDADFDCFLLAAHYHLLDQEALDLLPLCMEKHIGVFLGGVFATGILATGTKPGAKYDYRDAPAEILERVAQIETICASHNVSLSAAALQFPLAHPAVTSVIIGARSRDEVAANLHALRMPIPSQFWAELQTRGLLHPAAPVPADGHVAV